jgi:muramoyltetrapeptide carboxypeptidase
MKLEKPHRLHSGDTIKLIAPASTFSKERFLIAKNNLASWGFKVSYSQSIFNHYGNFAGTDVGRAKDFMAGIEDGEVRALYCIRGGFGAAKIIPYLDLRAIRKNPKILIGFSDITILHAIFLKLGIPSFHAPMLISGFEKPTKQFLHEFRGIFINNEPIIIYGDAKTCVLRKGKAGGRVLGGNLSLIISTLGTPYEIDTRDAILVIEDLDEEPYRIDRMLTQLSLAKKFDHLSGLIIGEFKNCIPKTKRSLSLIDIVKNATKRYSFPIIYNFPVGHNNSRNRMFALGIRTRMSTYDVSLAYNEKALRD